MMNFFEHCADIASVGIIVDFTEDTETYIVGSPADIKAWAYSGCPRKSSDRNYVAQQQTLQSRQGYNHPAMQHLQIHQA